MAQPLTGPCPDGFARVTRGRAIHKLMADDCDLGAVHTLCSAWYENAIRAEGSATRERHLRLDGDTPFTDFHPAFDGEAPGR